MRFVQRLILVACLLCIGVAAGAQDYALERAKHLAFMKGKPWRAVQGQGGYDQSSLNLLTTLNMGVSVDPGFLDELVAEWKRNYGNDQIAAVYWCTFRAVEALSATERQYWEGQADNLSHGRLTYGIADGTSFDDMLRWAYFWRYYGQDRPAPREYFRSLSTIAFVDLGKNRPKRARE